MWNSASLLREPSTTPPMTKCETFKEKILLIKFSEDQKFMLHTCIKVEQFIKKIIVHNIHRNVRMFCT